MSTTEVWHVPDAHRHTRRHWPGHDEFVVFNDASGDMHLLNAAAVGVLDRLVESPASLQDLRATFDSVEPDRLELTVRHLDRLGLIRPVLS